MNEDISILRDLLFSVFVTIIGLTMILAAISYTDITYMKVLLLLGSGSVIGGFAHLCYTISKISTSEEAEGGEI